MENYEIKCNEWLNNPYFSEKIKSEIRHMAIDDIKESFATKLEFGTGGMRGIMGPGTNRINIYTVRWASQGIANYIIKNNKQKMGIVIGYDTRNNSYTFAKEAALCFAANGIKAYLFKEFSPTPVVSFAIRKLKAFGGVNITASHNTKEYNGYKFYLSDGAQFSSPEDKIIIAEIEAITDFSNCKTMSENIARNKKLIVDVPEKISKEFLENVYSCIKNKKAHDIMKNKLRIVYTPLHGTGEKYITSTIKKLGYKNYFVVKEQNDKCGDFKTLKSPNPENATAFELAFALAKTKNADIIIATDPDADRLGVYVKHNEKMVPLTGNMLAALMTEYLLHFEKGIYKNIKSNFDKYYIIKSFVTSNLLDEIAKKYNVECKICLTGFKWIGKEILKNEQLPLNKRKKYLYGAEESYGCLVKDYTRDKDSISAALIAIEMASFFKLGGYTLIDILELIYKQYGYIFSVNDSFTFEGLVGKSKMSNIMSNFENNIFDNICGLKTIKFDNYNTLKSLNISDNTTTDINMQKTNALSYLLEDGSTIFIRPSGTEPKIKFYYQVKDESEVKTIAKIEKIKKFFKDIVEKY